MENLNVEDIHNKYVEFCVKKINSIESIDSVKSQKELLNLLKTTEEEYINHIIKLPKKVIAESDTSGRKLLSLSTLRSTLIQHIGQTVLDNIDGLGSVPTMEQLVNRIVIEKNPPSKELLENLIKKHDELPLPDIQGALEQIGEIILPPDIVERLENSFLLGQKEVKKRPAGFDKIGLVEQFLSDYLGRPRTTFQWKTGVLRSNQMRKVSYYHLYLPEINKTLLLNNQYGEGCFLLDGNFDIREAKKSDIKGTDGVVAISFDYSDPIKFLDKLDIYINNNTILKTFNNINSSDSKEKEILQLNQQEFIHFFHSLSPEEQNLITTSHASYPKRAKDKDNIPKTYSGLISLLGGNNKCEQGGYVKALIQSEEDGKRYFDNWLIQKEIPQLNKQKFLLFFHSLSPKEQTIITSNTSSYKNRVKDKNNIPKTYKGLTTLLGGNNKCEQGGYVKALIQSEEDGKRYFDNWLIQKEIPQLNKQKFLLFFHSLSPKEQTIITSNTSSYKNRVKDKNNIPKTYSGLISLLGGNNKCEQGGYVKALIQSEEDGKKYFNNWLIQKEIQLTKEEFLQFFNSLSPEEQNIVTSGLESYANRAKDKNNIPKGYRGLISLLGGNNKYQQGNYVKALIGSEQIGKEDSDNWFREIKEKEKNKLNKQEFIQFFNSLSPEEQNIVTSGLESYANRAKDKNNIPKGYRGLISLLGGNNKYQQGNYVKALIGSEQIGKEDSDNWFREIKEKEKNKLNKQEFIQFFNSLSLEKKSVITANSGSYLNRVKDKNNMPKTYRSLVTLLGGNYKCQQGGYVKALIQSEQDGRIYFDNRNQEKRKKNNIHNKLKDF